jgi:hypothetical protein
MKDLVVEDNQDSISIIKEEPEIDLQGDIYNQILKYMKVAERHITNHGTSKKEYVLKKVKEYLGIEVFQRYEPFIDISIDFIVTISKNGRILKTFKKTKLFCC